MQGYNKFDTEKYLLETLDRIKKNKSEYKVLYVNVSKLKPKNRHPKFVKIITRLFDDLVAIADSTMYVLSNGDFAILGKNISEKIVLEAVEKLRRGLVTDPIWTAHSSAEFAVLYLPEDFDVLAGRLEDMVNNRDVGNDIIRKYPVDAGQIDAVKNHIDEMNITDMVKHQSVLRFESSSSFKVLFEEFFVAVKDISKQFDQSVDLLGNKWLFLYLTQTLDKKTMYSFLFSDIQNKSPKVSVNLNLSTIGKPEFDDFCEKLKERGQQVIVEVQVMDILNNLTAYFDAKELLHRRGGEILIDATSIEMLQAMDVAKLEADYVKIFWHGLMGEFDAVSNDLLKTIAEIGSEKFILAKCMDEKAIRWGVKNGIRAFQGPYVDMIEVAMIRAKCPNGKVCSMQDCLKRKRRIAGKFRDECENKEFLEMRL